MNDNDKGGPFIPSWICPTEADAHRMNDALQRSTAARTLTSWGTTAAAAACAPWLGWWPFVIAVVFTVQITTLRWRARRARRPEYLHVASFAFTYAGFLAGAAVSGGPESPLLPLCALPPVLLAGRFRRPVVATGLIVSVAGMAAMLLALFPRQTVEHPEIVAVTTLLLVSAVSITASFAHVEGNLRRLAHIDPLTGMLNRLALDLRFAAVTENQYAHGAPVSLIVMDLDHFKSVNDTYGHDHGDQVLRESAATFTAHLRDVDHVFRLGGEEFAVLLPGVTGEDALGVAERLRHALSSACPGGLDITLSAGIATGHNREEGWKALYRRADAALLSAKRMGRDRCLRYEAITLPFGSRGNLATTPTPDRRAAG